MNKSGLAANLNYVLCFLFILSLSGCVWSLKTSNIVFDKNKIVIVPDVSECNFIADIKPRRSMWSGRADTTIFEVNRLKIRAIDEEANAISDVVVQNPKSPVGRAKAYRCPPNVLDKYIGLQESPTFIEANVKVEN